MRAVIDTNVIVSGLLRSTGPPAATVTAGEGNVFLWITSPPLLAEVERVLRRPHIRRVVRDERIAKFLRDIQELATIVDPNDRLDVSRDADDNRVLEAAIAGNANYIVTGDRDLLELRSYSGIRIVTPADFVKLLPR